MYARLVKVNDAWTAAALHRQVTDKESRFYGGITDAASGVARPSHVGSAAVLTYWIPALINPDSEYYHDGMLLESINLAADFMLNRQHADGTISLGSTNFNSPPDTAFVVGVIAPVYELLHRHAWPKTQSTAAKLKLFLERSIPAMLTGGCHTPNHRWVITAALALLYQIFEMPELVARADEWLAEGMDITADGEWTERSNGIYNHVSDIALYYTAAILGRPELLDYVRRNLRMMMYLVHPSGEVVTDYSGRQDFGQRSDLSGYFLVYRLMAALDQDALFAAMSDYAGSFITENGGGNNAVMGYLLFPQIHISDLERAPLPDSYVKILNKDHPIDKHLQQVEEVGHHSKIMHSNMHLAFGTPIVRIRDQKDSVTIMTRTPSFFSLRHGKVRLLGVKLASSFAPGIIAFNEFSVIDGGYRLAATLEKGYNGPIPSHLLPQSAKGAEVSPWYLLPHQYRPMTHLQQHRLEVELTQSDDSAWTIHLISDNREDVYTQLTFILGEEGSISGSDLHDAGGDKHVLRNGSFLYSAGEDAIEIEGGAYEHWLPMIREDQHPSGCKYVHINLLTPFNRVFKIRLL